MENSQILSLSQNIILFSLCYCINITINLNLMNKKWNFDTKLERIIRSFIICVMFVIRWVHDFVWNTALKIIFLYLEGDQRWSYEYKSPCWFGNNLTMYNIYNKIYYLWQSIILWVEFSFVATLVIRILRSLKEKTISTLNPLLSPAIQYVFLYHL